MNEPSAYRAVVAVLFVAAGLMAGFAGGWYAPHHPDSSLYRPVPGSRTVSVFGAPYNVKVVCVTAGSTGNGSGPLDLTKAARPGDVFVKTCRGYRP